MGHCKYCRKRKATHIKVYPCCDKCGPVVAKINRQATEKFFACFNRHLAITKVSHN